MSSPQTLYTMRPIASSAPPPLAGSYDSSPDTKKFPGLLRTRTSYSFNEETHIFSVVEPEKPLWEKAISKQYPGAIREEAFVKRSHAALNSLGFHHYNTLSCVSLCRDEMCSPFLDNVDQHWKSPFMNIKDELGFKETLYTHSFLMSSLGGMLFLGVTGMKAAISHAPLVDGRLRFVFFAFPHIGLSDSGKWGEVERPGHDAPSTACGALVGFLNELHSGDIHLELEPQDIEFSLLKQRLLKKMKLFSGEVPSIQELTNLAHSTILEDLNKLIESTVDRKTTDYAVLTGVQIHTPGGASYIWPGTMYVVQNGEHTNLTLPDDVDHHPPNTR